MEVSVSFYSYFKELTGCSHVTEQVVKGATLGDLFQQVATRFPRLAPMQNSTLMAIGVEYQDRGYILKPGDDVAFFPPVQGG